MPDVVNWLHLTDLHLGLDDQSWLWPKVKRDLFRDIASIGSDLGGWDLVFFTGDFVQRGSPEEYKALNKVLEELWELLAKHGSVPRLCVVPGNHDLVRPNANSAIAKTMTQLWWSDETIRTEFRRDAASEYRKAVEGFFSSYSDWLTSIPVPVLDRTDGILPGDFSSTFVKGGIRLGIVGLNTTFLQVAGGNLEGKLDVHVSQLTAVCDGDPEAWVNNRTMSVLLTHQPPSWLSAIALEHFRQEIYPPGRFFAQFCGHQHVPNSVETSEAGAAARRLRQGPSLFGLESWGDDGQKRRIHGYSAGQFVFADSGSVEKIWPRIYVKNRAGGMHIAQDTTFTLERDGSFITPLDLRQDEAGPDSPRPTPSRSASAIDDVLASASFQLLELPPDDSEARGRLRSCPHFTVPPTAQHKHVRQHEQTEFDVLLHESRCVWLVADWGTGKDGFIAASIERTHAGSVLPEVFHLRCDDATHVDTLEASFLQQFGLRLQTFCGIATRIESSFLILDSVHPMLASGEQLHKLRRVTSAILDYCPHMNLVLVCRLSPEGDVFPTLELPPLDVPDTRTYLSHHPDATGEFQEPDLVEKLHELSEGLPMHLDRILKALKVASLASVLEAELKGMGSTKNQNEETPRALVHAISTLATSRDSTDQRSCRLLKVLAVLWYGETMETLDHYLPTEPFFYSNALRLKELALLDVIPIQRAAPGVETVRFAFGDMAAPKILKVPRQVRDYVLAQLSDEEREGILMAGLDRLFGRKWREGKVKSRAIPVEYREFINSGPGNEYALLHQLFLLARTKQDAHRMSQAIQLSIHYGNQLNGLDRYRDLALVTGDLLPLVDRNENPKAFLELAALHGKGLRMIGKREDALTFLNEAAQQGSGLLSAENMASVWLNVALAEAREGNKDEAVSAARKVKELVPKKSASFQHALAVIADVTLSGRARVAEFRKLQNAARAQGHTTLEHNLMLDLAKETTQPAEKIRLYDNVLASREPGYNRARAIIGKAQTVAVENSGGLSPTDLASLERAYSYLHGQRFSGLFDNCHEVLWDILEQRDDTARLLRLFRHTSFVWRIRGEEEKEVTYLKKIDEGKVAKTQEIAGEAPIVEKPFAEVNYFWQRLKSLVKAAFTGTAAITSN